MKNTFPAQLMFTSNSLPSFTIATGDSQSLQ